MMAVADPSVLQSNYVLPPDYDIMNETAEVFIKSLLLGMTPETNQINFAQTVFAEPLPEEFLPYEEAVAYMRKRLPVDKETYYALSDKMRYRAFTVSRLADGDAVRRVQTMLTDAMEKGSGMNEFLQLTEGQLADAAGMGRGAGWYYETVYRTNTATAYNVGRAIGFEETPPVALELIGIDDQRQTELCHSLTVPPFRRPYDDPVWDTMWPPFHFNCRTTVRAIYDQSEIDDAGGPENFYSQGKPDYTPAKGFGKYPLEKSDTWWDLTDAMQDRAQEYGLEKEFEQAKEMLIDLNQGETYIAYQDILEERFGKDFTELYINSMEFVNNEVPTGLADDMSIIHSGKSINEKINDFEDYLKANKTTLNEFINEVNDFVKTGDIVRHDTLQKFIDNIDNFEADPRIKTQFETGTTKGYLSKDMRNFWERRIIGQADNPDIPSNEDRTNYGISDIHRPVYAEVTKIHPLEGNAKRYGDIAFIFSDEARNRTTYTLGNSSEKNLGSFQNNAATIFQKYDVDARRTYQNFKMAKNQGSLTYVEAQVWGGIDLSKGDIKAVVIPDAEFKYMSHTEGFQRFIQVLERYNIAIIKSSEWK